MIKLAIGDSVHEISLHNDIEKKIIDILMSYYNYYFEPCSFTYIVRIPPGDMSFLNSVIHLYAPDITISHYNHLDTSVIK